MLDVNDKADKWVFFYDQDSQDFKIAGMTTTTNYQIQHLVIPQIEFSNVHLEMQEPKCEIESNPDKEKILQDKYITHKEAAEYEKVIPVRKIIKVKKYNLHQYRKFIQEKRRLVRGAVKFNSKTHDPKGA